MLLNFSSWKSCWFPALEGPTTLEELTTEFQLLKELLSFSTRKNLKLWKRVLLNFCRSKSRWFSTIEGSANLEELAADFMLLQNLDWYWSMSDTLPEQQHTFELAKPRTKRARGKQSMRINSVHNWETYVLVVEPTVLPSQQMQLARRQRERMVSLHLEWTRLSYVKNSMDQLLTFLHIISRLYGSRSLGPGKVQPQ